MKNFTIKNYYQIGLSLTALSAVLSTGQSALAATFQMGGYQWDAANSVTTGKIIQGQEQTNPYRAHFLPNEPLVRDRTIGKLLGSNSDPNSSYSFTLGKDEDNLTESIIELGWGNGMSLANKDGNDLVIYESGGSGEPEAFAVAVKKVGASAFTDYRYQPSSGSWESFSFATAIDLSSFGLNLGDEIESIRIRNLIASDGVKGQDGEGFLGGQYQPKVGPNGITQVYETGKFDPDITFVAGLHTPKPVPEPAATLGLLVLGAFGISSLKKRKQH